MADLAKRLIGNPIISPVDILPSSPDMEVVCSMNPGAFTFRDKTWLVVRVAERPRNKEGLIQIPILDTHDQLSIICYQKDDPKIDCSDPRYIIYDNHYYLSTLSHLVLMCSDNGIDFHEPQNYTTRLFGQGKLESYGIEDCRVSEIQGTFYLTYTQVSSHGVGVGLMTTGDWKTIVSNGMAFLPTNKDCAIFNERINNKFYCLNRPSSHLIGGNFIWLSSSPDLLHWGEHFCLLKSRPGMWDSERIGAGAAPIRTTKGWLVIYHGADHTHRYCLGAALLDLEDPRVVIARADKPIMVPSMEYEETGFFGHVVFTNGHIIEGDKITMYYGASDQVICMATFSIQEILMHLQDNLD